MADGNWVCMNCVGNHWGMHNWASQNNTWLWCCISDSQDTSECELQEQTIWPIVIYLFSFAQKIASNFPKIKKKKQHKSHLFDTHQSEHFEYVWLILVYRRENELYWILEDEQVTDDLVDVEHTFYMKFR